MRDMEPLVTLIGVVILYGVFLITNPEAIRYLLLPELWWVSIAAGMAIASDPAPAQRAAKMRSGFCAQSAATGGDMASKAVSKMPIA